MKETYEMPTVSYISEDPYAIPAVAAAVVGAAKAVAATSVVKAVATSVVSGVAGAVAAKLMS